MDNSDSSSRISISSILKELWRDSEWKLSFLISNDFVAGVGNTREFSVKGLNNFHYKNRDVLFTIKNGFIIVIPSPACWNFEPGTFFGGARNRSHPPFTLIRMPSRSRRGILSAKKIPLRESTGFLLNKKIKSMGRFPTQHSWYQPY